ALDLGRVDGRHLAAHRLDHEMDARQHRLVELGGEAGDGAAAGLGEYRPHASAQIRRVALARGVDETGDEALERVAAQEQRDALTLLQIEDAERRLEKLVLADL